MWVFCVVSLKLLSLKIATNHVDVCVGGDVFVHVDTFVAADVDIGSMGAKRPPTR